MRDDRIELHVCVMVSYCFTAVAYCQNDDTASRRGAPAYGMRSHPHNTHGIFEQDRGAMANTSSASGCGDRHSELYLEAPIGIQKAGHSSRGSKRPSIPGGLTETYPQAGVGRQQAGQVRLMILYICFFLSSHYCLCRLPHWPTSSSTTS